MMPGSLTIIEYKDDDIRINNAPLYREWMDKKGFSIYAIVYYKTKWVFPSEHVKHYLKIIMRDEYSLDPRDVIHGGTLDIVGRLMRLLDPSIPIGSGCRIMIEDSGGDYPELEVRIIYYARA